MHEVNHFRNPAQAMGEVVFCRFVFLALVDKNAVASAEAEKRKGRDMIMQG